MTTRLDRLFILLENSTNKNVRNSAARQLGDVARAYPDDIPHLLKRLVLLLNHRLWDARVSAGAAVGIIAAHFAADGPSLKKNPENCFDALLNFSDLDITSVLNSGAKLLSTDERTFDESQIKRLNREDLNRHLGLDSNVTGHIGGSEGLGVDDVDLQFVSSGQIYSTMTVTEAVENSRKSKRTERILNQDIISYDINECQSKIKIARLDSSKSETSTDAVASLYNWRFQSLCEELLQLLWHSKWEVRHGSATALRELFGTGQQCTVVDEPYLEHVAVRIICLLALDQLSDFVSDEVVAPVRETSAQVLGIVTSQLSPSRVLCAMEILLSLSMQSDWMIAHGGLLGIKYVLAARLTQRGSDCAKLLPLAVHALLGHLEQSTDCDVRASAASALLPAVSNLNEFVGSDVVFRLHCALWHLLGQLEELSPATGPVLTLLAEVTAAEHVYLDMKQLHDLDTLSSFLDHYLCSVRQAACRSLVALLLKEDSPERLFRGLQQLFQRVLLEEDDSVVHFLAEQWRRVVEAAPCEALMAGCLLRLDVWMCLVMQPDHLAFDQQLFVIARRSCQVMSTTSSGTTQVKKPQEWRFAGGRGSEAAATREAVCLETRLLLCRMLAQLLARCVAASSHNEVDHVTDAIITLLGLHLESRAGLPRFVAAAVLLQMLQVSAEARDFISKQCAFRQRLEHSLSEVVYYEEILNLFRAMQRECRQLIADLLAARITVESVFTASNVLSLDQCQRITNSDQEQIISSHSTAAAAALREQLNIAREATKVCSYLQNLLCTRVQSMLACAAVELGWLGDKINPLVRPLMESVRRESNGSVRQVTAQGVTHLVYLCQNAELNKPADKVVQNLARYATCAEQETHLLVDLAATLTESELLPETAGGRAALRCLCRESGEMLAKKVPALWHILHDQLLSQLRRLTVSNTTAAASVSSGDVSEDLLQGLRLLELCAVDLHPFILHQICSMESLLCYMTDRQILGHSSMQLRHSVARVLACLVTAPGANLQMSTASLGCTSARTLIMSHLILNVVPWLDDGTDHSFVRLGVVETLYCVVARLELDVLPYLVVLLLPLLRRMGDQNEELRVISSQAFGLLLRLLPLEPGVLNPPGMPQALVEARSEQRHLVDQLARPGSSATAPLPIRLHNNVSLRSYQQEGVAWLGFLATHGLHGVLCDDLGLGKTLQATCAMAAHHFQCHQKKQEACSLVICPSTLTGHWVYEIKKYVSPEDLRPMLYCGTPERRQHLQRKAKKFSLIVASYEIVRNDIDFFRSVNWNYCVLDEGHVIKNTKSKLALALKQLRCQHRLILTGTPIQNNARELWSLFDFLMPGFLGTESQFSTRFAKPIANACDPKASDRDQERGATAVETLHRQVLPFMLRRLKEEVLRELPPKIIQDYSCELSPLQLRLYNAFTESSLAEELLDGVAEDGGSQKQHIFQALHYLRRVCNHPCLALTPKHPDYEQLTRSLTKDIEDVSHSGKLLAFRQLLSDMGLGGTVGMGSSVNSVDSGSDSLSVLGQHRALVFAQSKLMLDLVENRVLRPMGASISWLRLDGTVPAAQRHDIVIRFNEDPSVDLLLLTTPVGGLGLNLTGADTVIFLEHDWNPMRDVQAMDRAHRIGQRRVVHVYRLITRDTIEDKIMNLQRFKLSVANTVVSSENSSVDTLGADQLLDLFDPPRTLSAAADRSNSTTTSNEATAPSSSSKSGSHKKRSATAMLQSVGALWESREYQEEYDIGEFFSRLRRK